MKKLFLICISLISCNLFSQSNCANSDFSYQTYANWTGDVADTNTNGGWFPAVSWLGTGINANNGIPIIMNTDPCNAVTIATDRHVIMTMPIGPITNNGNLAFANGYDPSCCDSATGMYNLPLRPGYGGQNSLRLGSAYANTTSEKVAYSIKVSNTNTLFTYEYALVINNAGHGIGADPAFVVALRDSVGNSLGTWPCLFYEIDGSNAAADTNFTRNSSSNPFTNSKGDTTYYRKWTSVTVDLTSYVGHTVYIEFQTLDCIYGCHYCYAYISVNCGGPTGNVSFCGSGPASLSALPGFASYQWSGPNNMNPISGATNDTLNIANGTIGDIYYLDCVTNLGCTTKLSFPLSSGCVWPGDADENLQVDNFDLLPIGIKNNMNGFSRSSITNSWQGFTGIDWNDTLANGTNTKYVDCDGSGLVDLNDTMAVNLNYNSTHIYRLQNPNTISSGNPDIYLKFNKSIYSPGDTVLADMWIGSNINQQANFYGSAFSLDYEETRIKSGSEKFTYNNSWVGNINSTAIKLGKIFSSGGYVDGALVRTTHTNVSGFGKIAQLKFILRDTLTGTPFLHFNISNAVKVDNAGQTISFVSGADSVPLVIGVVGTPEFAKRNQISIYPNPSTGNFSINSSENIDEIKVTDILGNSLIVLKPGAQKTSVQLESEGVYFIEINSGKQRSVRKVVVSK